MLVVRAVVKPVSPEKIGLFADQPIYSNHAVWQMGLLDHKYTKDQFRMLPEAARDNIRRGGGYVSLRNEVIIIYGDISSAMRHSTDPSLTLNHHHTQEATRRAAHDIAAGEELTCDYREIASYSAQLLRYDD